MSVPVLRFFLGGAEKKKGKGKTKMRFMKRIAAIMLSVVMVLGMSSVVSATTTSANSGTSATTRGKITITNAIPGQTYTIYKILELESYSYDGSTPENGKYAYKVATGWDNFVDAPGDGSGYLEKDATSGYVTWKTGVSTTDDTVIATFAKEALAYAKDTTNSVTADTKEATNTTVEFDDLDLGYYLVESSTGALCSLTTTNNQVSIREKNGVPSVEKKVQEDSKTAGVTDEYGDTNTADIGQTVHFKTTITAQAGAVNYVLHDTMSEGLTFSGESSVKVQLITSTETRDVNTAKYTVKSSGLSDNCTFEIEFKKSLCDTLKANDKLIITYTATLNEKAAIGGTPGNTNETKLTYGNNKETEKSRTTTKTFELPVFKYTEKTAGTKEGLAGAKFVLNKDSNNSATAPIKLVSITAPEGKTGDFYRVAKTDESGITEITTKDSGKFTIQGLDADTYYLHEIKQPDGYNKLKESVKVGINENGAITVGTDATVVNEVEVLNNTGSLLPSTGGRGTTILYVLGALLVLGSSVVLITKRRMKE